MPPSPNRQRRLPEEQERCGFDSRRGYAVKTQETHEHEAAPKLESRDWL